MHKDKKGTSMIGAVTAVLIAVMGIAIGIIIIDELGGIIDPMMGINATGHAPSADAGEIQAGWNSTKGMAAAGFNVLPVVIIILAALPVIGAVLLLGR